MNLGPTELIVILLIVLVLFGGAKLPKLARSLGQAQKEFKQGINEGGEAAAGDEPADRPVDKSSAHKPDDKPDDKPAT